MVLSIVYHTILAVLRYRISAMLSTDLNTRAENVSKDHTVHDIVVADRLRQRQGIHWILVDILIISQHPERLDNCS